MAKRRMFTKDVTDSDAFIEMSSAAQALYFHLNQAADDDGFNNQIQVAMLKAHASTDDLKVLLMKNFIVRFESGVVVIKHWRLHNTLRRDRYTPTNFQEEFNQLGIKENGIYTLGCQTVAERLPQDSIGKDSINNNILSSETDENSESDIEIQEDNKLLDRKIIIDYLNSKTNRNFRYDTASTIRCINARLNKGYTVSDFKLVIDLKVNQWLNDSKMSKYLRPETLFGNKFEGYLNEIPKRNQNSSKLDEIF